MRELPDPGSRLKTYPDACSVRCLEPNRLSLDLPRQACQARATQRSTSARSKGITRTSNPPRFSTSAQRRSSASRELTITDGWPSIRSAVSSTVLQPQSLRQESIMTTPSCLLLRPSCNPFNVPANCNSHVEWTKISRSDCRSPSEGKDGEDLNGV